MLGYSTADFSSRAAWHDDEMTGGGRWGGEMRHVLFLKVQSTSESEKKRRKKGRTELCDYAGWYSVSINYFLFGDTHRLSWSAYDRTTASPSEGAGVRAP